MTLTRPGKLKLIAARLGGAIAIAGVTALAATSVLPVAAQTATPTATPAQQTPAPRAGAPTPANGLLDRVAAKLGVTTERLRSAIVDAAKDAINARVAEGRLTREQGDRLIERIEKGGPGLLGRLGRERLGERLLALRPLRSVVEVVANTTGLTVDQVRDQLRAGKTLAEIGAGQGKTQAQLQAAILAAAKPRVDTAVANGTLTRAQGDRVLARLPQGINRLLTRKVGR